MAKLNLGCGEDIKKGWINVDFVKLPGVDTNFNLNKFPWPFKDNTFELVYASHVIEHLEDLPCVMEEIKRICKKQAKIKIRVPHFSCGLNYRDPTHKRLFSYFTFDYFSDNCFYNLPEFKINKRKLNFTRSKYLFLNYILNPIINLNPILYERFFCWLLPCSEILFELEIKKD